jgi:predicted  nucleic acid-binding Zn-ribbon protein
MSIAFDEQLDFLVKLQDLDIRGRALNAKLAEFPTACASLERRLDDYNASLLAKEEHLDALKKRYRESENRIQDLTVQIAKSDEKLHAVKTNKEYQSSLKEIEDLKTKVSGIEDGMLEDLEAIESAENEVHRARQEIEDLRNDIAGELEAINAGAEQDRRELADVEQQYAQRTADIQGPLLSKYETIRAKQPDAVAVCEVIEAVCQGCNVNIPPQLFNDLQRRSKLILCPKCMRILYWIKRL